MSDFASYLHPGAKGHLIGIGGVSMSPLAEVLHGAGLMIGGSDMSNSAAVAHLRELGIRVQIGHAAENIPADADFVVRTAAVHDDNVEIVRARELGIPVFERTQAWGAIMRDYKNALCIAGTHGKTTTTSMSTHILMAARRDPTVMIGGTLPLLHAGHRVGGGDTIIMESCEYYNSFLSFSPTVANPASEARCPRSCAWRRSSLMWSSIWSIIISSWPVLTPLVHMGASLEFATIYRNVLSRVRAQRKRECDFFREE